MKIQRIFERAICLKASDIHLSEGHYPFFRVNGNLISDKSFEKNTTIYLNDLVVEITGENCKNEVLEGIYIYKGYRLRYNILRGLNLLNITMRIISKEIQDFKKLNLPKNFKNVFKIKKGLVLISGKMGSGKSTTLSSIISEINVNDYKKIVTLEDPIEYVYKNGKSLVVQRQIGIDISDKENIKKTIVRMDADIIVFGEIRTNEEIKLCIELAELGHLVMATIHANSITDTINRLVDVFDNEDKSYIRYKLSVNLNAVLNQELLTVKNEYQVPICEFLILDEATRNMIKENKNNSMIYDRIYALNKINGSETKIQNISNLIGGNLLDITDLKGYISEDKIEKITKLNYNRNIIEK